MTVKIASIRGIDRFAKKSHWANGFSVCNDNYIRLKSIHEITDDIDCFVQFNIYNPYRQLKQEKIVSFKKILETKKPFLVWEEGSFRTYSDYKKVGWFHFNNTGIFNNSAVDDRRWKKIVSTTGIKIKDWKSSGSNILIMGQIELDSALISLYEQGYRTFFEWIDETIENIRKYTDRPIIIRSHPNDVANYNRNCQHIIKKYRAVSISKNFSTSGSFNVSGGKGLIDDLREAYCAVTYNSNSAVEALCEGIPVFALDSGSVAYDIAHKDISQIEKLNYDIDISKWCNQTAYTVWNPSEVNSGEMWSHLKPVFFKE